MYEKRKDLRTSRRRSSRSDMYVLEDSGQLACHVKKNKLKNDNNKVKEGLQVRALLMKLERLTLEYGPVIVMYDPL